jgi:hypothetical protein
MKRTQLGSWMAVLFFFVLGIFSIHIYLDSPHSPSHI